MNDLARIQRALTPLPQAGPNNIISTHLSVSTTSAQMSDVRGVARSDVHNLSAYKLYSFELSDTIKHTHQRVRPLSVKTLFLYERLTTKPEVVVVLLAALESRFS